VAPGSGAAAAGLRGVQVRDDGSIVPGDVIVELEGTAVESVARLLGRLDERQVGETVRLTILRDGKRMEVRATLQAGSE
jgi:S1-C subfamily serine protease